MKIRTPIAALALDSLIVTFMALAEDKSDPKKEPASAKASEAKVAVQSSSGSASTNYPVICYLEKKDRSITVKAGPKGTLYSVKTSDGKVLCDNVSLDQLRAQAPELHDFIKSAYVLSSDAKRDARVRFEAIMR